MTNTDKYLVLLGLDKDKKPRAAKFTYAYETSVRRLATISGYRIGHAKTDEAVEIALKLVDGRVFHSGKGLVPLVNAATYEKLLKVLEVEEPAAAPMGDKQLPPPNSTKVASSWDQITAGTIVLYHDELKGKDRGWWEATVTGVSKDGKSLTLRWTHFPTLKPLSVKRNAVALLPVKG